MRVYTIKGFKGHWPVPTAAVVVAANRPHAERLFRRRCNDAGIPQPDGASLQLSELDTTGANVRILSDGDY